MLLSVLTPSISCRSAGSMALHKKLVEQSEGLPVEIVCLMDNRSIPLSTKRNALMRLSTGKYFVHLDDDDDVSDDFIATLVNAASSTDADVISYNQEACVGGNRFTVRTGLGFENEEAHEVDGEWADIKRKPWHWCAWHRRHAEVLFPATRPCEDHDWLTQIYSENIAEEHIDKVLHYYQWSRELTTF